MLEEKNEVITVYATKNGRRVDLRKLDAAEQDKYNDIIVAFMEHLNGIRNNVIKRLQCDT